MSKHWWRVGCVAGLMAGSAWAADADAWIQNDFAAAQAKAVELKKDLLVDFSGSDWCGWCIRLNEEVFNKPEFIEAATKDFVLVVLDFPRKPENKAKIPEALQTANRALMEKHGVQGFPTVLLMKADGTVIGQTGYRPGGPAGYVEHIKELKEQYSRREAGLAKAREPGLSPADRAKALDAALSGQDESMLLSSYRKELDEIVAADADNALGLRGKYQSLLRMKDIEDAMNSGETDRALGIVDDLLKNLPATGEKTQETYGMKFSMLMFARRVDEAKAALQKAIDAAPDSEVAPRMKAVLERLSEPPEAAAEKPTE
ncbi:MAG: thioredoxin family protein [Kiritimatiellae bacterium]|nr:thioredoxin family protein [Kiritimatiellia bacterium]